MIYLDANVVVASAINTDEAERVQRLLRSSSVRLKNGGLETNPPLSAGNGVRASGGKNVRIGLANGGKIGILKL
jgi:hypothetical protein